jgi:hypothetical protein
MQMFSQYVAHHLNNLFGVSMVVYSDDWLIFGQSPLPATAVIDKRQHLGITINEGKPTLNPTDRLTYLGLAISIPTRTIQPTTSCIQDLQDLTALVPRASRQDLARIAGYVSRLTWAMGWPRFLATDIFNRETFWMTVLRQQELLQHSRRQREPLRSTVLCTDATPMSLATFTPGPPLVQLTRLYDDQRHIAFAEMAAAIVGLI